MRQHGRMTRDIQLLRFKDLKAAGIIPNRTTLHRWLNRAVDPFPKPIRLGENFVAWRLIDVEQWLKRAATGSGGGA
jgi:predicted DNA-binding transcriptional regulator AlpA